MKQNKTILFSLLILIIVASVYRIMPNRPYGFAPQWAMAIFAGAIYIKDKKWAFALPIVSMLISDILYEILYINNLSVIQGFYEGQYINYLLFAGLTCIGFFIKNINIPSVLAASVTSPVLYFIVSNFIVWANGGGFIRPKTMSGLMQTYTDGLPFLGTSIASTIIFSFILFGGYFFYKKQVLHKNEQIA